MVRIYPENLRPSLSAGRLQRGVDVDESLVDLLFDVLGEGIDEGNGAFFRELPAS